MSESAKMNQHSDNAPSAQLEQPTQYQLRPATLSDIELLTALINRAYRPVQGQEGWTHETLWVSGERVQAQALVATLNNPYRHLLVLASGALMIGSALITGKEDGTAYIGLLTIDPPYQANGLGTQLLQDAEQYAKQHLHAYRISISVVDARTELIAFYERRGYEQTGHSLPYPTDQAVGQPKQPLSLIEMEKDI